MKLLRQQLFTLRSYTPIPFLLVMIVFAQPTMMTMAVGVVLVVFGESMRFWGVAYAGSLTRVTGNVGAPEVIVSGPFAYVRNPLYVGNMLTYIGVGVMSNALFPWLVSAAAVYFAFQYFQIVLAEEEFLVNEFGVGYVEYKRMFRVLFRASFRTHILRRRINKPVGKRQCGPSGGRFKHWVWCCWFFLFFGI